MSNNAKAVKSIRKTDLVSQKTPFVAFKAFSFAHEATAGQTVISLSALTVPTSYASRGFVQPSVSDLSAANLLLYRRNLRLQSTLRGVLMEYDAYDVTGSLTIRLNFPAESGEIFVGVISDVSKTGLQVIDGQSLVSTGVLGANASDYVVGQSFALNKYSTKQVGDILVFLDGQLMYRNAGNATASVSADGNYQEIDAGSGLSNTIRFNIVDPVNARPITVLSNGMLAERPEGSLRAEIETLAGQNDSIIETLAVVAGVPTTNFRSAPNSVDLQTFGQRVIAVETKFSGFVRGSEGAGTTTLVSTDYFYQIFNLTAARTCVLPTTGIKSGDLIQIENRGDFDLTIQSSSLSAFTLANGANQDATIKVGFVTLRALQDAPTAVTHWMVVNVQEVGTHSITFTVGSAATKTIRYSRNNASIVLNMPILTGISNVAIASTATGAMLTRLLPSLSIFTPVVSLRINAVNVDSVGGFYMRASGQIDYYAGVGGTTTFGASGGTNGFTETFMAAWSNK